MQRLSTSNLKQWGPVYGARSGVNIEVYTDLLGLRCLTDGGQWMGFTKDSRMLPQSTLYHVSTEVSNIQEIDDLAGVIIFKETRAYEIFRKER